MLLLRRGKIVRSVYSTAQKLPKRLPCACLAHKGMTDGSVRRKEKDRKNDTNDLFTVSLADSMA